MTASSGPSVVAWAVEWQHGPNKRAIKLFKVPEDANEYHEWREGPCCDPVVTIPLVPLSALQAAEQKLAGLVNAMQGLLEHGMTQARLDNARRALTAATDNEGEKS